MIEEKASMIENDLALMKPKFSYSFVVVFDKYGKNCSSNFILIYKQCLNFLRNVLSNLFTSALMFSKS